MNNLKIVIKPFEIFADQSDRDQLIEAIMLHLEEIQEENFFKFYQVKEDEDDSYGEEYED